MPRFSLSATFPNSSAIARASYHPDRQTLDLWYKGGDRYTYFDVPAELYQALSAAESAGEFVNLWIKPHFRYEIEPSRKRFRPASDE